MEEEQAGTWITQLIIILIVWAIIYLLLRGTWTVQMDGTIFFLAVFLFLFSTGHTLTWYARYKSPHFTCNNLSESTSGTPDITEDGKFAMFDLGAINYGVNLRGWLGTAIVPAIHVKVRGRQFSARTKVVRTPVEQLPKVVRKYFSDNPDRFNDRFVYFGVYSEDVLLENVKLYNDGLVNYKLGELVEENKLLNELVNFRSDLLRKNYDEVGEIANIKDVVEPRKGFLSFLKKDKKEEPDDS